MPTMTPWSLMLAAVFSVTPEPAGMRVFRSVAVPFWLMKASWPPLPSGPSPTITPLALIDVASASPPAPKCRSVALPLAHSTACALSSLFSTAEPTTWPEALTASAAEVKVDPRAGSFLIAPLTHSTAIASWVVVSALPTIVVPAGSTATALASTPRGSSGSTLTVVPWIVKDLVRSPLLPGVSPKPTIRPPSLTAVAWVLKKLLASTGSWDKSVGAALPAGHFRAVNRPLSNSPTTRSPLLRPSAVAKPLPAWPAGAFRNSGVPPAFRMKGWVKLLSGWGASPMMSPLLLIAEYVAFGIAESVSVYRVVAAWAGPAKAVAARAVPVAVRAASSGRPASGDDARRREKDT